MKKYMLAVLMTVCATTAFADNNVPLLDNRVISTVAEPKFAFYAADTASTIVRRLSNQHVFSRDRLTDRFCWELTGLPANKRLYNADLELIAPTITTFVDLDGNRVRSLSNIVNVQLEAVEGRIGECGAFEAGDPPGEYQFNVTVEGKKYPMQSIILR